MKIVISDSSTLILLTKSNLTDIILNYFQIFIPSLVYEEILEGKKRGFPDAFKIDQLIISKKINIKDSNNEKLFNLIKNNYKLDVGELHAIVVAKENNYPIFLDDRKGLVVCKIFNIEAYTALNLLKILFITKIITKKQFNLSLEILKENARYSKDDFKEIEFLGSVKDLWVI